MPFDAQDYVSDPVLKVLIDADALLSDESKWCKGEIHNYVSRSHQYCAMGAIQEASKRSGAYQAAIKAFSRVCPAISIPVYNDAPETKYPDIKALFAKAIAAQRETTGEAVFPGVGR